MSGMNSKEEPFLKKSMTGFRYFDKSGSNLR